MAITKKKDFDLIAQAIKDIIERKAKNKRIAEIMADALEATSPKFDRIKFLEACGVKVCKKCGSNDLTIFYKTNIYQFEMYSCHSCKYESDWEVID